MSALCSCDATQFHQTRSRGSASVKPIGSFRSREPRVQMPPLDLGFPGQTSAQVAKPELLHGYQSDESSSDNHWDMAEGDRNEFGPRQPKQLTRRVNHDPGVMHLSGQRKPPSIPKRPFTESRQFHGRDDGYEYSSNQLRYSDSRSSHAYGMFEQNNPPQRNHRLAANPDYAPPFARNARPFEYYNPGVGGYRRNDHVYVPHKHTARPLSYFEQFQSENDEPNIDQYYKESPPVAAHRSVGHESNYQTITEEEIARHMKEYEDGRVSRSDVELPRLPPMEQPIRGSNYYDDDDAAPNPSSNHLVLSGSLAHDQIAQRFLCAASPFAAAGVETLFDEIDTNHDGVIRLEELRNFVWLHEVIAPH